MATIILAGGFGLRIGREKASVELDGTTLAQRLVSRFAGKLGEVILVARPDQEVAVDGAIITHDMYQGIGPLAGLHAGLSASPDEENFAVACDMPFADPELAAYLVSLLPGYDAVLPLLERGLEPLHAAYRRSSCLSAIETAIVSGRRRMAEAVSDLNCLHLPENEIRKRDPELRSFFNINTEQDFADALRLLNS